MQCQFLHSPICNFTHNDLILAAAIDFMRRPEFLQKLSRSPELPDNFPTKLHLVDFAILHVSRAARVPGQHCTPPEASKPNVRTLTIGIAS
jgi:hypothetical protein